MILMKKGNFALENANEYSGYDTGIIWNGWRRPFFTKSVAEKIIKDNQFNSDGNKLYDWSYEPETDRFVIVWTKDNGGTVEVAEATKAHDEKGEPIVVYAIGDSWCWHTTGLVKTTYHLFKSLKRVAVTVTDEKDKNRIVELINDGYSLHYFEREGVEETGYCLTEKNDIRIILQKFGYAIEDVQEGFRLCIDHQYFPSGIHDKNGDYNDRLYLALQSNEEVFVLGKPKNKTVETFRVEGKDKEQLLDFVLSWISIASAIKGENKYDFQTKNLSRKFKEKSL